jgi:hypothetical protein
LPYKNTGLPPPIIKKSEDDVKKEREDMWEKLTQDRDISEININQVIIKRDFQDQFGLEIAWRKGFEYNLYDFEI